MTTIEIPTKPQTAIKSLFAGLITLAICLILLFVAVSGYYYHVGNLNEDQTYYGGGWYHFSSMWWHTRFVNKAIMVFLSLMVAVPLFVYRWQHQLETYAHSLHDKVVAGTTLVAHAQEVADKGLHNTDLSRTQIRERNDRQMEAIAVDKTKLHRLRNRARAINRHAAMLYGLFWFLMLMDIFLPVLLLYLFCTGHPWYWEQFMVDGFGSVFRRARREVGMFILENGTTWAWLLGSLAVAVLQYVLQLHKFSPPPSGSGGGH